MLIKKFIIYRSVYVRQLKRKITGFQSIDKGIRLNTKVLNVKLQYTCS